MLNIAGKIEAGIVAVIACVHQASADTSIPYVIVGATARDLILHYGHGAEVQRATRDIDFAIQVKNWSAFEALQVRLGELGFTPTKAAHRLLGPERTVVDIVPCGGIEDDAARIAWPPEGEVVMNVLGFQEACAHAEWVRINEEPDLAVPVATPIGMILLKLIAWAERSRDIRKRDALDIAYLLSNYEKIPEVRDSLFETEAAIMEACDWDITLASAQLLGQRANAIAQPGTRRVIVQIAAGAAERPSLERLMEEMCTHVELEYERHRSLLAAFFRGFGVGSTL